MSAASTASATIAQAASSALIPWPSRTVISGGCIMELRLPYSAISSPPWRPCIADDHERQDGQDHRPGGRNENSLQPDRKHPMKTVALGAILTAALLVGCGGSPDKPINAATVYGCLSGIPNVEVSDAKDDLDLIAANAGVKGINVEFENGQDLTVAIERGDADAKNTLMAYKLFFAETGPRQLEQSGPVVLAYNKTPTAEETGPVDKCVNR